LRHRDATGAGQFIDLALLDVAVAAMAPRTIEWTLAGKVPERLGTKSPGSAPAQVFACADGHINIQAGAEADFRQTLRRTRTGGVGRRPAIHDRAWTASPTSAKLEALLGERIRTCTRQDLSERLTLVGFVASPIYRAPDMVNDPQVVHRGMHFSVPDPTVGAVPLVASPMRLSATPIHRYLAPPTLGQHTDEILAEVGYDSAAIAELRAAGAV
jgi:formyl-CoA transferase